VSLLRQWKDERFFLYVHYMDVHSPYWPPEPYRTQFVAGKVGRYFHRYGLAPDASARDVDYTRSLYDGEIRALDDSLRSLLGELSALGLDSSTTVVLVGDHGDEFLEHGGMGHGTTLHRELTHVPLIIRAPGGAKGERVSVPVSLVDLWPTLADLTGTPAPAGEGVSLAGLLDRDAAADLGERILFSELGGQATAQRGAYKLIRSLDPPSDEAYDLSADPLEQRPLRRKTAWRGGLDRALRQFLAQAPRGRAEGPRDKLDAQTIERLRALGYAQ
jgi:arylsulfatase A-like enzyme